MKTNLKRLAALGVEAIETESLRVGLQ